MKKILFGIASTLALLMLTGCGSGSDSTTSKKTGDQEFIEIASKSINNRWEEQDKVIYDGTENAKNIQIIEKEIQSLEQAKEKITDSELLKTADDYINGTKKQVDSLKTQDLDLQYKYSEESEKLRKPALINLVDKYNMKINDNNKQTYDDFKAKATIINHENQAKSFAEKLANEVNFESSKEYSWTKYIATLENTSEFNFEYIHYTVQFKDADGIVVDNSILSLNNFTPNSKQKTDVSTDKEHKTVSVQLDDFYLKN